MAYVREINGRFYCCFKSPDGRQRSKACGTGSRGEKVANRLKSQIESQLVLGQYEEKSSVLWGEVNEDGTLDPPGAKAKQSGAGKGSGSRAAGRKPAGSPGAPETFLDEYYRKKISLTRDDSQQSAWEALGHFTRIVRPRYASSVSAADVDEFVRVRSQEDGKKIMRKNGKPVPEEAPGPRGAVRYRHERISPATVNKELRSIRAALRCAARWGYLKEAPEIQFLRENQRETIYVSDEQFARLYQFADVSDLGMQKGWARPKLQTFDGAQEGTDAKREQQEQIAKDAAIARRRAREGVRKPIKTRRAPRQVPLPDGVTAPEIMRCLMMFLWMTGWRITQSVKVNIQYDVDYDTGDVFSPNERNKGRRDVICRLHEMVLEHLKPLQRAGMRHMVPDGATLQVLYRQFRMIQDAAKTWPARHKDHFGFHDLRRGFATMNAENLDLFELQRLMQHKSLETTRKYVNMARKDDSVKKLAVPDIVRFRKEA